MLARTICGEPMVLMRNSDGVVCALEDRCSHRSLPLSQGTLRDGTIQCRYHGVEFDCNTGNCTKVPGQDRIPKAASIKSYPAVERNRAIWVWTGDADKADESLIPSFGYHDEPGWGYRPTYQHIKADYRLVTENLMDLTHVAYAHLGTLAGDPEDQSTAGLDVDRISDGVRLTRVMHNTQPGPFHVRQGGFKGEVDRWQIITFQPGIVVIDSGMTDAGKGGPFNIEEGTFNLHKVLYNGITPETEHTMHYFWSMAHVAGSDRPAFSENLYQEVVETFDEDIEIIEAQYKLMRSLPDERVMFDRISDAGVLQTRKVLGEMIAREEAGDEIRSVS